MSKGRSQNPYGYNRPSGSFQKNMAKQQLDAKGVKQPKAMNEKKLLTYGRILLVVWIALTVLATWKFKWIGLIVLLLIGVAAVAGIALYFRSYGDKSIEYYQAMGMPKEMYMKEMKKRNVDKKQLERVSKTWDRVAKKTGYEPVINTNKNTKKRRKKKKK